jgi:hypothetical protein
MVKVRYDEGVAIHIDPESCAGVREGVREALTGARAGQPLSGENSVRGADALEVAEGNTAGCVIASTRSTPRRLRPWHVRTSSAREPGDLLPRPSASSGGPHWEGASQSQ